MTFAAWHYEPTCHLEKLRKATNVPNMTFKKQMLLFFYFKVPWPTPLPHNKKEGKKQHTYIHIHTHRYFFFYYLMACFPTRVSHCCQQLGRHAVPIAALWLDLSEKHLAQIPALWSHPCFSCRSHCKDFLISSSYSDFTIQTYMGRGGLLSQSSG